MFDYVLCVCRILSHLLINYKRYMKNSKCKCSGPLGQCQDESLESETAWALMLWFDSASPGKSYFVVDFVLLSLSCAIQKHSNAQAQRNKTVQTNNKASVFMGSIVKTKHQSLIA